AIGGKFWDPYAWLALLGVGVLVLVLFELGLIAVAVLARRRKPGSLLVATWCVLFWLPAVLAMLALSLASRLWSTYVTSLDPATVVSFACTPTCDLPPVLVETVLGAFIRLPVSQ